MFESRARYLCAVLLFQVSCSGPDPVDENAFPSADVPVHCWPAPDAPFLSALGDATIAVGFQPTFNDLEPSVAKLMLLSDDEGRTFRRVVGEQSEAGAPYRSPATSTPAAYELDDEYYISLRGLVGVSRNPGDGQTFTSDDWLLAAEYDGEARDLLATRSNVTLPGGAAMVRLWTLDEQRQVARAGFWFFASTDAGATWRPLGPVDATTDHPTLNGAYSLRASNESFALYEEGNTQAFVLSRPGDAPVSLRIDGNLSRITDVYLWGERLVYIERGRAVDGSVPSLKVDDLNGTPIESWVYPYATISEEVDFVEDAEGVLYLMPRSAGPAGGAPTIVRLQPGGTPTALNIDYGAAPFFGVRDALARPDGRLLYSIRTTQEERRPPRHFGGTMLCEIGPGVTQSIEALTYAPLSAAFDAPGNIVRLARFSDGSTVSDRFVRTSSGRLVATARGYLSAFGPDSRFVNTSFPEEGGLAETERYSSDAILRATDTSITTTLWAPSNMVEPPVTQQVSFDLVSQTPSGRRGLAFGNEQVFDAQLFMGRAFWTTGRGTFFADEAAAVADYAARTRFPDGTIFGGEGGVAFDDGYQYERGVRAANRPAYLRPFNGLRGQMPEPSQCQTLDPPPPDCIAIPDVDVTAARISSSGDVYVADFRHGQVLRLREGEVEWDVVATGFRSPSDLRLVDHGEDTAVLVYDGDIFAFVPTNTISTVPAAYGTPEFPERVAADTASTPRTLGGCQEQGPCIDAMSTGILAGASPCVTGAGFGDAGQLLIDGEARVATSYADAQVCFDASERTHDAQVAVVRADGARSNSVPYHAPVVFGEWRIPDPLTPLTPLVIEGQNLLTGDLSVSGALVVRQSDSTIELLVPATSAVSVSARGATTERILTVGPSIAESCFSGAADPCEMVVLGLGPTLGRVEVGGASAEVDRWAPPLVRFRWPAGTAVGVHNIAVFGDSPSPAMAEAELVATSALTLIDIAPRPDTFRYSQPRPTDTSLGVLFGATSFDDFSMFADLVGVEIEDNTASRIRVGFGPAFIPGQPFTFVDTGEEVLLFAVTTDGGEVLELSSSEIEGGLESSPIGNTENIVIGASMIDDHIVLALSDLTDGGTRVVELTLDGGVTERDLLVVTRLFGVNPEEPRERLAHGVHFGDSAMYLSQCHNPLEEAEARYVSFADDTELSATDAARITFGGANATMLACTVGSEDRFVWVQREQDGVEHLVQWSPATMSASEIVVLPPEIPGFGERVERMDGRSLPGTLDVLQDGDDWVFLVADRESEERGFRLVRWRSATDEWSVGDAFGNATRTERGELCVGPLATCEDGYGRYGCTPLACPVETVQRRVRESNAPQEGYLLRDAEGNVHAFTEPLNTAPATSLVGAELQHHLVTLP